MRARVFIGFLIVFLSISGCFAVTVETPDGAIIYYDVKGEGPALLFVHGEEWVLVDLRQVHGE